MRSERPVQTGDLISNTYRLEHVLGRGTSGVVFAARDRRSQERVAIKVLRREFAEQRAVVDAFRACARSAAALCCSEVCRVYELAETEAGAPCIVMEYLDGWDLASELDLCRRYESGPAVGYILEACAGLESALRAGVIHADLKPSKLFVLDAAQAGQRLKLLDIGGSVRLATSSLTAAGRRLDRARQTVWREEVVYAAPEQLDAPDLVDARTNVWALGAILYSLVCGRPPFAESIPQRLIAEIRAGTPPPPRALGVEIPDGVQLVLERALCKSRADRFASVSQLAQALAPHARGESLYA